MQVTWFVSYLCSGLSGGRTNRDAINFIKAIKGTIVPGLLNGLDTKDGTEATEWFGKIGALVLARKRLPKPIVLVPVPGSDCMLANGRMPRTAQLARSVAKYSTNALVFDGLRWRKATRPSHKGGIRDAQDLYNNLILVAAMPEGTCVIVDDVLTTGSHIRAAAAKMSSLSCRCSLALCVGRTVSYPRYNSFSIVEEEFCDFAGCPIDKNEGGVKGKLPLWRFWHRGLAREG